MEPEPAAQEEDEPSPFLEPTGAPAVPVEQMVPESKLTLEEASARLGPEVLKVLEDKFNGSLTEIRPLDGKDQIL